MQTKKTQEKKVVNFLLVETTCYDDEELDIQEIDEENSTEIKLSVNTEETKIEDFIKKELFLNCHCYMGLESSVFAYVLTEQESQKSITFYSYEIVGGIGDIFTTTTKENLLEEIEATIREEYDIPNDCCYLVDYFRGQNKNHDSLWFYTNIYNPLVKKLVKRELKNLVKTIKDSFKL